MTNKASSHGPLNLCFPKLSASSHLIPSRKCVLKLQKHQISYFWINTHISVVCPLMAVLSSWRKKQSQRRRRNQERHCRPAWLSLLLPYSHIYTEQQKSCTKHGWDWCNHKDCCKLLKKYCSNLKSLWIVLKMLTALTRVSTACSQDGYATHYWWLSLDKV